MWRHYLTTSIRVIARNPLYAAINIIGLAIGMAACMALLLYARFENSYDRWLPQAERVFQLQTHWRGPNTPAEGSQETPYRLALELKREFPQVESAASVFPRSPIVKVGNDVAIVDKAWIADPSIFDVLDFPFASGDGRKALAQPNSVVLTETQATKLFGSSEVMGDTLPVTISGIVYPLKVTGILKDLPEATHFDVGMIIRLDRSMFVDNEFLFDLWTSGTGFSYVKLKSGSSAEAINTALPGMEKRLIPPNAVAGGPPPDETVAFSLANVRKVHLGEAQGSAQRPGNDPRRIAIFTIAALLLLGMSCINFINLATARSTLRAREVALRKVVGARRRQLIAQFVGESTLIAAIGMILALALIENLSPLLRPYLASALDFNYFGSGGILGVVGAATLLVGVLSGLYPAIVLSSFPPAVVLKANTSSPRPHGKGRLRNVLVVGQFAVSIALITCTVIVYAQTSYVLNKDMGFRKEGLIAIDSVYRKQVEESSRRTLLDRIAKLPGVTAVARTNLMPPEGGFSNRNFQVPGKAPQLVGDYYVGPGYFATMGLPLLAGREFSIDIARDEVPDVPYEATGAADAKAQQDFINRGLNVVINETAVKALGLGTPTQALGKTISADLIDTKAGLIPATVVGVARDAQFESARKPIGSIIFIDNPANFTTAVVRFDGIPPRQMLASLNAEWRSLIKDVPLVTSFVDEDIAAVYERDILEGQMFALFAALATLVGSLGLFGLAAFSTQRRTREIGLRKVLGAKNSDILKLMLWQFTRPVLVANLIAWPLAWWLMRDWLNGFSERIPLGPQWFVVSGLLALVIALATTAAHSLRVSRANPIHALRYE